jgi:hypothetical protein
MDEDDIGSDEVAGTL